MSVYRMVLIYCDNCDRRGDMEFVESKTVSEIRRTAREAGWIRRGGRDVCQSCVEEAGTATTPTPAESGEET